MNSQNRDTLQSFNCFHQGRLFMYIFFTQHLTECDVGFFGANCKELCSLNCKTPGSCDKVKGQCEGGCQAGWTQRKCETSMYVR